jgi:hypothetical protein
MKSSLSFAKVWFIVSFAGLAFLYGTAVGKWEWFPHSFLNRAIAQARSIGGIQKSHEKVFDRHGARTAKQEKVQPGLTAVTSWWTSSNGRKFGAKLMSSEGEVVHEWMVNREELFEDDMLQREHPGETDIHGSHLLANGELLVNLEYVGMARIDACGEVLWTLTEGNHHSISQAEDGSFWVPAVSQTPRLGSEQYPDFPGLGKVWMDRILHVSEGGEIIQDINVLDILYSNGLEHFLFKYGQTSGDVTHINDIEPLSSDYSDEYPIFDTGDLLVSARNINLVFVVDPETGEVKWHVDGPFIQQHDPDYIGDGWVGVFDNSRGAPYGSRILGFKPNTDSMKVLFQGEYLERFSTSHKGKWEMLGNGNMLLTEEEAGRVVEVSPKGKLVWEWVHEPVEPWIPFFESRVPSVSQGTRTDLTREDVASWPCSSVDSIDTSSKEQKTAP